MKHVKDSAIKMGIDYVKIPPRDQSLNEAEKGLQLHVGLCTNASRQDRCASFAHAFCSELLHVRGSPDGYDSFKELSHTI